MENVPMVQHTIVRLKSCVDGGEYFRLLGNLIDCIVVICVKDTPGVRFTQNISEKMSDLGLTVNLLDKHWFSYIALINNRKVHYEKIGKCAGEEIDFADKIDNMIIDAISSPYRNRNLGEIHFNGYSCSANRRGLNIAVFDKSSSKLVDSVTIDLHEKEERFFRLADTMSRDDIVLSKLSELEKIVKSDDAIKLLRNVDNKLRIMEYTISQMFWQLSAHENETPLEVKKRFFLNLPHAEGKIKLIQLATTILLKHLHAICLENGLQYWVVYGTLLGAVRHKGFIPWDDDVDVGMFRSDIDTLYGIMENDSNFVFKKLYVFCGNGYINYCRFMSRDPQNPCFIDVFTYDYVDEYSHSSWLQLSDVRHKCNLESQALEKQLASSNSIDSEAQIRALINRYAEKQRALLSSKGLRAGIIWCVENFEHHSPYIHDVSMYFPFKLVEFEGIEVYAPKMGIELSRWQYGDIFTLPTDMFGHKHFAINDQQVALLESFIAHDGYVDDV